MSLSVLSSILNKLEKLCRRVCNRWTHRTWSLCCHYLLQEYIKQQLILGSPRSIWLCLSLSGLFSSQDHMRPTSFIFYYCLYKSIILLQTHLQLCIAGQSHVLEIGEIVMHFIKLIQESGVTQERCVILYQKHSKAFQSHIGDELNVITTRFMCKGVQLWHQKSQSHTDHILQNETLL